MANYNRKVTGNVFDAVKICLQSGNTATETAKFMRLSLDVVRFIRDAENFDEYAAMMAAKNTRKKQVRAIKAKEKAAAEQAAKAAEKPQDTPAAVPQVATQITPAVPQEVKHTVQVQATRFMEEQMKKQTELLTIICNKLGAIIDDLYGTKEG